MESVESPNQFELGLSSMTSLLSNIALGTKEGNSFLNIIEKDIFNFKESTEISLVKIMNYSVKKYDALTEILSIGKIQNFLLNNIYDVLTNKKKNIQKPSLEQIPKIDEIIKKDNDTNYNSISDKLLTSIDKNILNIFNAMNEKTSDSKTENKPTSNNSNFFSNFKEFAESLLIVKTNLTAKLMVSIDKFGEKWKNLLEKVSTDKINAFSDSMEKFQKTIESLTKDKSLKTATYLIGGLALSFIVLSLSTINPMFITGMGILAGFIFILSKIGNDKKLNPGLELFGLGILSLTGSLFLMQFVPWEATAKLLLFIGGLGIAMKTFNSITGNKDNTIKNNPMMLFGIGIASLVLSMLTIQFVPWEAIGKMIVFITGLGFAMGQFNFNTSGTKNGMVNFALGIGILTLSLFAMGEIPWSSIFKGILFIGGLGLVMSMFKFDNTGTKNSMINFAFGLGILVLAILAIGEIPTETLIKGVLFIGALGLVMKLYNFDKIGPKNGMINFAFGFGILVLAMFAMEELPWETLGKTLLFIGGLGLVLKLFNGSADINMLAIGAGIAIIAGALWIFKKINWSLNDALIFGGTILGLAGIYAIVGIPAVATLIGLGVLAMIGMSIGTVLIGLSLAAVSNLPINNEAILPFMLSVGILSLGFAAITPFAVLGAAGALLFLPIAGAALLGALSLWAISKMVFNSESINTFIDGAKSLSWGFASLSLAAIPGAAGAILFLPIAGAALLGAGVLLLISKIVIDNDKINKFNIGAKSLVDGINNIGIWDLTKTGAKALLLIPIFTASWLASKVLESISKNTIDSNKIMSFGQTVGDFTTMLATVLSENEDKLESAKPGIDALAKLMNVSSGIARTIQMMANLQFYEYGVENGKLVLKSVKKLTPNDFFLVGKNLGLMLKALIDPLVVLGSSDSTFNIGGMKITNPFASNKAERGIEILSQIGNAFKPLAESVKIYSTIPMVSNPKLLDSFKLSFATMINIFVWSFEKLKVIDTDLFSAIIDNLNKFINIFKNVNTKNITDLNSIFEKFVNNLSDQNKWKKIQLNLAIVKKQFGDIAKNINSIDIEKATAFERNIKNLMNQNNAQSLKDAAIALTDILGLVQNNQSVNQTSNTPVGQLPGFANAFGFSNEPNEPKEKTKNKKQKTTTNTTDNSNFEENVISILQQIASNLGITNQKLGEPLKVKVISGNSNSLS